ncbi:hypothetical protein DNU06_02835 [Putridiphycobacter roseus]|uniref:DUF4625 domain-containing protein n=1 Tax=Putridiphycobacter roseus TaxID=2219161 RepID=A0A2W1NT13_9FLAO|nr:DUF4625 domain-containing protein [Putridiphycobacter roseus]PZE18782.1 hypothetical protein DNU06_02835 [Putridiphycobacter roseus]
MKNIFMFATIALLSTSIVSCNKDKENPTIVVSTPENHTTFKWGEEVHVEATFTDDTELKSYKVFVGDADGNHNHDIGFMEEGTTTETSYEFHEHFMIPDSVASMAYIYFEVTDAEEKTTTEQVMIHFEE